MVAHFKIHRGTFHGVPHACIVKTQQDNNNITEINNPITFLEDCKAPVQANHGHMPMLIHMPMTLVFMPIQDSRQTHTTTCNHQGTGIITQVNHRLLHQRYPRYHRQCMHLRCLISQCHSSHHLCMHLRCQTSHCQCKVTRLVGRRVTLDPGYTQVIPPVAHVAHNNNHSNNNTTITCQMPIRVLA